MTNFDKQLKEAVATYASISGYSVSEIIKDCSENQEGTIAESIKMLMFAVR
jgi:hypothetical protein